LTNGDFVQGHLADTSDQTSLHWHSRLFARPLVFPMDRVANVQYSAPGEPPARLAEYCFELAHGDVLFGSLRGLSDTDAELEIPRCGRIHVRRDHISRLFRCRSEDLIYGGPSGLTGWKRSSPEAWRATWRDDEGVPATDQADVFLYGDFKIPAQAAIEFELSWKKKADFVFALDVDENPKTLQRAFRFEVWDSDIVVHRETEREADVVSVQQVKPGAGQLHLQTYLDRKQGRLLVFSETGLKLADLQIRPREAQEHTGLWLANKRGDVRLDRLRIRRWDGVAPHEVPVKGARVQRADGSLIRGQLTAFDPVANLFTVRDSQGETTRVAADQISSVFLSPVMNATGPAPAFRVVYQDGTQFSGTLSGIENGHILLESHGIRQPLRLPIAELRSLSVLDHRKAAAPPAVQGRTGTLEIDGIRLRGQLVDGRAEGDASCLVWQPEHSDSGSPLRPGLSGRIVYREPPPPPPPAGRARVEQRRVVVRDGVARVVSNDERPTSTKGTRSLHLRSGDTIPCEVEKIDERGVTFQTPFSHATFVEHAQVKAVELSTVQSALKLNKAKRERLLTLPRMQRGSPPTHLICSSNGDFLRGRLLDMDQKSLRVEIRLESKELERQRVSQIIWLHEDELDGAEPLADPPSAVPHAAGTRVQVLRSDGVRFTFLADKLAAQTLSGTSDVLGACDADLSQVDQLVFGGAIEKAAKDLVYHQWTMHNAIDPKFAQSAEGQAPPDLVPGTESALVGKPAPDFELGLVGGAKFRLADSRGKIVVLDFWATWCGPCMQAMPLIEKAVDEFDGQVQLIAVNLEETDQQISAALERHNIRVTSALDRNGAVAAKYAVTAIPQTMVIDRAGTVARVFVGGGPHLGDQLREALQGLVERQE
jgi:thiol-disulfide isomerase/thioredoxin